MEVVPRGFVLSFLHAIEAGIVWKPLRDMSSHSTCQGTQSLQLAEPLWTDLGLKSGSGVHELLVTSFSFFFF